MKQPLPFGTIEGPGGLKAFAKQLVNMYFLGEDAARFSVVSFASKEDGPFSHGGIGHGPGHGHNDERLHEEPSVMIDHCCLPVDNVKVAQEKGSVMGEPCTGKGACLLIEGGDTFSCEIDPDRFTGAKHCAKDIGIWCGGGRKCGQK